MDSRIEKIASEYGINALYVFGSRAGEAQRYLKDGKYGPSNSDLDIAVEFGSLPPDRMKAYGMLYVDLSSLFEPFEIDLVFMDEMTTLFKLEIIRGVRLYAKNPELSDDREEQILKIAADLEYSKRISDAEILEAIRDGYRRIEYRPPG